MSTLPRITMGTVIAQTILNSVDNGKRGVHNPANWPEWATHAVEYRYRDKQFPTVPHEAEVCYFESEAAYQAWVQQKRDFCRDTDGDFTVQVLVYEWDWGPQYIDQFTLYWEG